MWQSQHVELQSSDIVEIRLLQESELQMYWTFDCKVTLLNNRYLFLGFYIQKKK